MPTTRNPITADPQTAEGMFARLNLRTRTIGVWLVSLLPTWVLAGFCWRSGNAALDAVDLALLAILGTAISALLTYRGFLATRRDILEFATAVQNHGEGNYAARVSPRREGVFRTAALACNRLARGLTHTQDKVRAATDELDNAAAELVALATESRQGAHQQSEAVALIAGAVEQMSSSIAQSAQTATQAAAMAAQSTEFATLGKAKVRDLDREIETINDSVATAAAAVDALGERSQQIGRIIEVIHSIADQTNLLALNAAIESARAGEHGRGFSVVADEVRSLAHRTTESSGEVGRLIRDMQSDVAAIVQHMGNITRSVNAGVASAEQATRELEQIKAQSDHLLEHINHIAQALVEQQHASGEAARQLERINLQAQEHDQAIERASATAVYLTQLSGNLNGVFGTSGAEQ